jgi:Na+/H+ antiporter NhaD/arsenite permease-like protein
LTEKEKIIQAIRIIKLPAVVALSGIVLGVLMGLISQNYSLIIPVGFCSLAISSIVFYLNERSNKKMYEEIEVLLKAQLRDARKLFHRRLFSRRGLNLGD